jgi:hypothetical protein
MAYKDLEKRRATEKARREANPEKSRAAEKAWREVNPEKVRARIYAWREANPEKVRASSKHISDTLTDSYIARNLHLSVAECPPELIEMKREQLKMARTVRELTNLLKEENHD